MNWAMVPEGWRRADLSEVAQIILGQSPPSAEVSEEASGFPFLQGNAEFGEHHPTATSWAISPPRTAPQGSILLSVRAPVGDINRADIEYGIGRGLAAVAAGNATATQDYLFWVLANAQPYFDSRKQGSTFDAINKRDLLELPTLLPPLPEQRKIAAILSSVDDAIAATRKIIEQTKRLKQGLLQTLMTRGIGHSRFKKTAIGKIPEEWKLTTYGSIAKVVRGSSPRPAGDSRFFDGAFAPWITVAEITKDDWPFLRETAQYLTEEGSTRSRTLPRGTLVLVNSGATLGVPKILDITGCANDGVAAFLGLDERVEELFLYYHLSTLTNYMRDSLAPGVGQPNLNTTLIAELSLPLPNRREQAEIARQCFVLDEQLVAETRIVDELTVLKRGLMQDLLTGRVRVQPA